jgi:outer membrane protein TolC
MTRQAGYRMKALGSFGDRPANERFALAKKEAERFAAAEVEAAAFAKRRSKRRGRLPQVGESAQGGRQPLPPLRLF